MRDDRTALLFGIAISTACLSITLGPLSAHTYCENRPIVGLFAIVASVILILFIRNRALTSWKRILSGFGIAVCVLTTVVNTWFIWYATRLCRHMLDPVKP
jgi:ABC-type cobalamin transport system permease subunit